MKYGFAVIAACVALAAGAAVAGAEYVAPKDVTQAAIEAKHTRYGELKKAANNRDTDETRAILREIYADQAAFFAARADLDDEAWLNEGNPFRYNWKMIGFLRETEEGRRRAAIAGDRILALPAWGGAARKAKASLAGAADCVLRSKDPELRRKAAYYLRMSADIAKAGGDYKGYANTLDRLAMTLLKDWLDRPAALDIYREGFRDPSVPAREKSRIESMIWQLED